MRKYLFFIFQLSSLSIAYAQTPALYNNGAALYISQDARVQVNGDFINKTGSELENAGIIATTGSVTNDVPMTEADAGELLLQGTTAAVIGGSPIFATNVTIDNSAGFTLNTPLRLSGQMTFTAGVITIPDSVNAITFASGASVNQLSPPSNASHINGFVVKEGNGSFIYPVGNGIAYQPVEVNLTVNSNGLVGRYVAGDAGEGQFTAGGTGSSPLVARNTLEHWSLTPIGSAAGTVTIYWDDYNNTGIANIADLAVAHLKNGSWVNEGANSASGTANTGIVTSNSISTWSPFTLGSTSSSSPLPVRLISFSAKRAEDAVSLNWRVADAKTFSQFEIERGLNTTAFQQVGRVVYNGSESFNFNDLQLSALSLAGKLYYRLKLVDNDGTFAYSRIETVYTSDDFTITVYPNPVVETIHLKVADWSKVSDVRLFNNQGNLLYRSGNKPIQEITAKSLKPGLYFVKLALSNGTETTKKIVIGQ